MLIAWVDQSVPSYHATTQETTHRQENGVGLCYHFYGRQHYAAKECLVYLGSHLINMPLCGHKQN